MRYNVLTAVDRLDVFVSAFVYGFQLVMRRRQ